MKGWRPSTPGDKDQYHRSFHSFSGFSCDEFQDCIPKLANAVKFSTFKQKDKNWLFRLDRLWHLLVDTIALYKSWLYMEVLTTVRRLWSSLIWKLRMKLHRRKRQLLFKHDYCHGPRPVPSAGRKELSAMKDLAGLPQEDTTLWPQILFDFWNTLFYEKDNSLKQAEFRLRGFARLVRSRAFGWCPNSDDSFEFCR